MLIADDSVVKVLQVHRGREGGVEDLYIALFQVIGAVFQFANLLPDTRVSTFQEGCEKMHGLDREVALLIDQSVKIRHTWKNTVYQPLHQ